jgi:hypothetical protein
VRIDQHGKDRCRLNMALPELLEAPLEERCRDRRLTAGQPHGCCGKRRRQDVVEVAQKGFGLFEPALPAAELGQEHHGLEMRVGARVL